MLDLLFYFGFQGIGNHGYYSPWSMGLIVALKPASLQWSEDGSVESADYGDVYFQRGKGLDESRYIFLEQNKLDIRFKNLAASSFSIAELGFGTGLNFLLTAQFFLDTAPADTVLHYFSFEKHPIRAEDLSRIYAYWKTELPLSEEFLVMQPPMTEGFHSMSLSGGRIRLTLLYGDVRDMLPQVIGSFDAWYLDGFAPARNPDMWEDGLYQHIADRTKPNGTLATFSVAGRVWRGLEAAGFTIEKVKGFGIKWSMITARMNKETQKPAARRNIAVIGAGIAGCTIARNLAERGHNIALIDRQDNCAMETSGNPLGVVYPKMTVDPSPAATFYMTAFSTTRALLNRFALPSWKPQGVLHQDLSIEEAQRNADIVQKNEYPPEAATYLPGQGLLQPLAGTIDPREWCRALVDHAHIQKLYTQDIGALAKTKDGWAIEDNFATPILQADIVIIAAGWASTQIEQTKWLPLQSLRGQLTFLKPTGSSAKIEQTLCHEGYIAPAQNAYHVTGATFQKELPRDFSLRQTDHIENLQRLQKNMPQFKFTEDDIIGGRASYRAATPDKLPLVGPCPVYDEFLSAFSMLRLGGIAHNVVPPYHQDLYMLTGLGSHGLTAAPLAADVIAAMIDETPLPVSANLLPYLLPDRLILRDLKRGKI